MEERRLEKINTEVYIGKLLSDDKNSEERFISYVLRTDGLDFVAQEVFEYLHTQEDEYYNPHLTKNCYLVQHNFSNDTNMDSLLYEKDIELVSGYSVKPMIKIANAGDKTEEEISNIIAYTGLPMIEKYKLLHNHSYQKVKQLGK